MQIIGQLTAKKMLLWAACWPLPNQALHYYDPFAQELVTVSVFAEYYPALSEVWAGVDISRASPGESLETVDCYVIHCPWPPPARLVR